jgi:hypothetical protein
MIHNLEQTHHVLSSCKKSVWLLKSVSYPLKALDDSMISGALSENISFHDTLMPFYKLYLITTHVSIEMNVNVSFDQHTTRSPSNLLSDP